jgi:transposase
MKTALATLKKYKHYIINAVRYNLGNGLLEGINNKIKAIKRIAFGYRSFYNFKNRILISCHLIGIKNVA